MVILNKAKVLSIKKEVMIKYFNDLKEFDIVKDDTISIYTRWSSNRKKGKYFKNSELLK
jgi:hypothetical protein